MSESFNGYYVWLGIPLNEQPPNHYRLLGITAFETDPDVIDHAADRQMAHVRTFQGGRNSALSQRILNELAAARVCLLNPPRKAEYDEQLRAKLATGVQAVPVGKAVPVAQPATAIPRAAPLAKPIDDDDPLEVDESPAAPLATPVEDEAAEQAEDSLGDSLVDELPDLAPPIEVRAARMPIDRDASLQRALIWIFAGVAVVIVVMMLFGMLRRAASTTDWRQWFTVPEATETAPAEPGSAEDAEPPPAAPTPAPPVRGETS